MVNAVSVVAPWCGSDALRQRSQLGYRPWVGPCYRSSGRHQRTEETGGGGNDRRPGADVCDPARAPRAPGQPVGTRGGAITSMTVCTEALRCVLHIEESGDHLGLRSRRQDRWACRRYSGSGGHSADRPRAVPVSYTHLTLPTTPYV